jgi:DNA polymerase III psi subunit
MIKDAHTVIQGINRALNVTLEAVSAAAQELVTDMELETQESYYSLGWDMATGYLESIGKQKAAQELKRVKHMDIDPITFKVWDE